MFAQGLPPLALRSLSFFLRSSLRSFMPIVSRTLIAGDYLMALVKSGSVKMLSAYLPNDALVTMHNLRNFHGKEKKGVGFDADLSLADGDWPPDLVPESDGQVRNQKVHLCSKDCKKSGKVLHLDEWAYLDNADSADDKQKPLLAALVKAGAEMPVPPGLRERPPPDAHAIETPSFLRRADPAEATPEVVDWARRADVLVLADALGRNDVRTVAEIAALTDHDIEALFATENIIAGVRARCRLALKSLRAASAGEAEKGSGWFDIDAGRELSAGALQAAVETRLNVANGIGFARLPGRGWCELRRCAPPAAQVMDPQLSPATGTAQNPAQDFGAAGPLEELAANAQLLLRQLGAEAGNVAPAVSGSAALPLPTAHAPNAMTFPAPPRGMSGVPGTAANSSSASVGRVMTEAMPRQPAKPVSLKVSSRQAAEIVREWSGDGKVRLETAVLNRTWKKAESKAAAMVLARTLDAAEDSGLSVSQEGFAEIPARELVELWFADKTGDTDTAEHLRESSMATWGLPKQRWVEAKEARKLAKQ